VITLVDLCEYGLYNSEFAGVHQFANHSVTLDVHFKKQCIEPKWNENFLPLNTPVLDDPKVRLTAIFENLPLYIMNPIQKLSYFYRKLGDREWKMINETTQEILENNYYDWEVPTSLNDGIYEVVSQTHCEEDFTYSQISTILMDFQPLLIFSISPIERPLKIGEVLSITFTKDLDCQQNSVSVKAFNSSSPSITYSSFCQDNVLDILISPNSFTILGGKNVNISLEIKSLHGYELQEQFTLDTGFLFIYYFIILFILFYFILFYFYFYLFYFILFYEYSINFIRIK